MRILLISDIHGNLEALEATLAAAPAYDRLVNLGDVVGYGASPNEVSERARELAWITVRGNHDKACSGVTDVQNFNPIAALAANWTRQQLTPENLAWLRTLPQGPMIPAEITGLQFVHGSPIDEDEYMVVIQDALEPLLASPLYLTFFGHSHIQGGFCYDRGEARELRPPVAHNDAAVHYTLELSKGTRYMINPGSVGQPRDGDWRCSFALFDLENFSITFYRIPYDLKRAQQRIRDAQLPERLAARLAVGR